MSIAEVEPGVSVYISYPHFAEGERKLVVNKTVHKIKFAVEDEFFDREDLKMFEERGSVSSVGDVADCSDSFLLQCN